MNLFQMTQEAKKIYDYLTELDIDEQAVYDTIDGETGINEKLINYGHVIRAINADVESIKQEQDRLAKRKRAFENHISSMKERMLEAMNAIDMKKVTDPLFTISVRNNAESVEVLDESKLSDDYFKIKKEVSKTAIKEALQSGKTVDGARLIRTQSVVIK